jgi:2-phospho-L-lactate guanylyltransferase
MRTIAVLPIKNCSGARQALAQAMFSDVLAALRHLETIDEVVVVTSDPAAEAAALNDRVRVLVDHARSGQSAAAAIGVDHALSIGAERVLLVPGDTPLIDPREVDDLLERSADERLDCVIVPDREGSGTNALLLAPPDALSPSFGPGSRARYEEAALERELRFRVDPVRSLSHDVDTPEDLADLAILLDQRRELAPRTRGALSQLGRVGGKPPAGIAEAVEALTG